MIKYIKHTHKKSHKFHCVAHRISNSNILNCINRNCIDCVFSSPEFTNPDNSHILLDILKVNTYEY